MTSAIIFFIKISLINTQALYIIECRVLIEQKNNRCQIVLQYIAFKQPGQGTLWNPVKCF